MKLYQRYFLYGSVLTSLAWGLLMYLYFQMQDDPTKFASSWPSMDLERRPVRLKPRYDNLKAHKSFDFEYDHDKFDLEDGMGNVKHQTPSPTPSGRRVSQKDLSELGIIRHPEDQKVRDEGNATFCEFKFI